MVIVNPHIGPDESGHEPINPAWLDLCSDTEAMERELRPVPDPALMHIPPRSVPSNRAGRVLYGSDPL